MSELKKLLDNNKQWAESVKWQDPKFFERLSAIQTPEYLWIGCSDSRIPPASGLGLLPGEMFIHRNIANLVVHTDMNCLSVMQYAVEVLKVKHIIICGHYGCGGVRAALEDARFGLIDNWLRHIQDVINDYENELEKTQSWDEKFDKLCEINLIEQVINAGQTTIVQDAWLRGQTLAIHGWIYHIRNGIFQDLQVTVNSLDELKDLRRKMLTVQERR